MNIISFYKKYGFKETVRSAFIALGFKIQTYYMKQHYLTLDVDVEKTKERLKGFDYDFKELTYEDFLKGNPKEFLPSKLDFIKHRLEDKSYRAYGIIEDDYLIYSTWISTRQLGLPVELKHPLMMAENEGLLEDSYCDPKARGRGIHSKMNDYRIVKLYELGKKRIIAIVLDGNTPAFKTQFKSGFTERGIFYCGKILGRSFVVLNKSKFKQ